MLQLGKELYIPNIKTLLSRFLFKQQYGADNEDIPKYDYPQYLSLVRVFNSANTFFYTPSDIGNIYGMHCEVIHTTLNLQDEGPQYDYIFINTNSEIDLMNGLEVAHILLRFGITMSYFYPNG